MKYLLSLIFLISVTSLLPNNVNADDLTFTITFKDHHFEPQQLELPPHKKIVLKIENQNSETIEFESFKLNREKPIEPGKSIEVYLPELSPGHYDFYDDFHKDV